MTPQKQSRGTLAVVAVAVAAAATSLVNQFTLDDAGLIVGTDRLHGLVHWREILASPYWPPPYAQDLYRPLTSLLLALQYQLGAGSPLVFRLVSLALIILASVAVLRLGWRLCPPAVALGIALLFAAHPVHVEAVVLAVAQGEILVGLLGTSMVVVYLDGRRGKGLGRGDWLLLGAMYVAAGLTKEQGMVLPALLIAAELLLVRVPPWGARVRDLWQGYAALALLAGLVLLLRGIVLHGTPLLAAPAPALMGLSLAGRTLTMLQVVPEWLRLLAWPWHLRADYSPAEFVASREFGISEALGLAILIAAVAIFWLARRRAPVVAFGLAWCAIMLLPVSNLFVPTGILLAERTLFSPSIGFLIAAGGAAAWFAERSWFEAASRRRLLAAACVGLVLAGIVRSGVREREYRDAVALTFASARDAPRSARVQQSLGETLFDQGRTAEAVAAFRRAIAFSPEPWALRIALARRLRVVGDDEGALEELRLSLAQRPTQAAMAELAAALLAVGKYAQAARIAEGIIASGDAPPIMLWLKRVADSAQAVGAPPGSVRVGILRN